MKYIKLIGITSLLFLYAHAIWSTVPAKTLNLHDQIFIAPAHTEEKSQNAVMLDLSYPQIQGVNLSVSEEKFNQLVRSLIESQVIKFKKIISQSPSKHHNLIINYQVYVSKPENHHLISVLFTSETMVDKAAHPVHDLFVLNYDLSTGKTLMLSELFEPHSEYYSAIADYSKKVLKHKFPELQPFTTGLAPTAENYPVWNLRASDILIHFAEAQVAPRVYGMVDVVIPYQALKEVPLVPWLMPCADHPERCVAPSN